MCGQALHWGNIYTVFASVRSSSKTLVMSTSSRFNHTNLVAKITLFPCVSLFVFLCKKCFSSAQQNVEV